MSLCIRTNEMFHFPAADVSSMNFYAPSQGSTESDSCMIAIHTNVLEWLAVLGKSGHVMMRTVTAFLLRLSPRSAFHRHFRDVYHFLGMTREIIWCTQYTAIRVVPYDNTTWMAFKMFCPYQIFQWIVWGRITRIWTEGKWSITPWALQR